MDKNKIKNLWLLLLTNFIIISLAHLASFITLYENDREPVIFVYWIFIVIVFPILLIMILILIIKVFNHKIIWKKASIQCIIISIIIIGFIFFEIIEYLYIPTYDTEWIFINGSYRPFRVSVSERPPPIISTIFLISSIASLLISSYYLDISELTVEIMAYPKRYCNNCMINVLPKKKFKFWIFIVLLISTPLFGIPAIIYPIAYIFMNKKCPICKGKNFSAYREDQPDQLPFSPDIQQSNHKFCTNCGNLLISGASFCPYCGKQIIEFLNEN
ncbi:MAG: zinc ribbon domain-containing protein [Promethearchaeota archaeon]